MDSAYLLSIGKSPDHAELVNSFLRNAGLAVRVENASNPGDLEDVFRNRSPFLTLLETDLPASLTIGQVVRLAEQYSVPVVVQVDPGDTAGLLSMLADHPMMAINKNENDQLLQVVKHHMDGSRSKRDFNLLQHELTELKHRYDLLLDSSRDAIAYVHEGLHVYANRAYLGLFQARELQDIEGMSLLDVLVAEDGSDLKALLRGMNNGEHPEKPLPFSVLTQGGGKLASDVCFAPVKFNGEPCTQMIIRTQDAHLVLNDELASLRQTDQLTKMVNRRAFNDLLSDVIKEPSEHNRTAILYIEPDGIAELQRDPDTDMESVDTYILDLANVIRACIDEDDIPARYSEHGFAILIRRDEKSGLHDTGDRIISNYANHIIDLGDQTMSASCSVGLATLGSLTLEPGEVINQARRAYRSAAMTGNTLVRFKPALTAVSAAENDRDWVERIRYALNNHDLYTIQQSIVNLEGENEGLFENRVFIREDDRDTMADEFMHTADQHDLGGAIDRHIIPRIMSSIAGTGDRHIIPLSVNTILDFSFPSWFRQQLTASGTEASQIILQVSAIAAESNLIPTRRIVSELQTLGCGVLMSDFDNNRRIDQLLEHLPVDMVRLRQGLARGLSSNNENQEIVRAVVSGVNSRGIPVIADEVNDASDLAVLWQCGIKLVAGDFLNEAPQVVGQ